MTLSSHKLLKLALPLVRTHGFTRQTLANSVLALPPEEAHSEPLSDTAVSALFGEGDAAQISLVNAWLDEGINEIRSSPPGSTLKEVLSTRLRYNEHALGHLPQAFALLTASRSLIAPLDPRAAIQHVGRIADEACHASGDQSLLLEWYARRGSVAAVYTAAGKIAPIYFSADCVSVSGFPSSELGFNRNGNTGDGDVWVICFQKLEEHNQKLWNIIIVETLIAEKPKPSFSPQQRPAMASERNTRQQPGFEPNFTHTYTVTIDKPYEEVFRTIGTPHGHDKVTKLSKFCTEYNPLGTDEVAIIASVGLQNTYVRGIEGGTEPDDSHDIRVLSRQSFKLMESVPIAFGLFHVNVTLCGTICWDEETGICLYESESANAAHIKVWKCRWFERESDSRTKVTETVKGVCPWWMRRIVEAQTRSGHVAHMDQYYTLFEDNA